jgi:hypothetical protein
VSRALDDAVRLFADQQSAAVADRPTAAFVATVTAVAPGAASDGNALVTVVWRGRPLKVAYAASYTPVAGHRVKCDIVDGQAVIAYRIVGTP